MNDRRNFLTTLTAGLAGLIGARALADPNAEINALAAEAEALGAEIEGALQEVELADLPTLCVRIETSVYERRGGEVHEYEHFAAYPDRFPAHGEEYVPAIVTGDRRPDETAEDFRDRIDLIFGGGWTVEIEHVVYTFDQSGQEARKRAYIAAERRQERADQMVRGVVDHATGGLEGWLRDTAAAVKHSTVEAIRRA